MKLNIYSCIMSRSHHAIACVDYSYLLNGDIHANCNGVQCIFFAGFNRKATKVCHL